MAAPAASGPAGAGLSGMRSSAGPEFVVSGPS
jgi:hypothetical protein